MGIAELLDELDAMLTHDRKNVCYERDVPACIREHTRTRQHVEPVEEITRMETLGTLVDKLVTVNLKMWHNQEVLYEIRRMGDQEFREAWGDRLDALHDTIKRCCDLNVQRSKLMDEIDRYLQRVADGEIAAKDLVREQHKTY